MNKDLSTFVCPKDPDIQDFIRNKAINYEKRAIARTYLLIDVDSATEEEPGFMAFFSIGISHMTVRPEVPNHFRRKLNVMLKKPTVPCYVLGQLGKNERYWDDIEGSEIIDYAMHFLLDAHRVVGGCFVRIDCKEHDKLVSFYKRNGFEFIQKNEKGDLLQFVKRLDLDE